MISKEKPYKFVERTLANLNFMSKLINGESLPKEDFNDFTNLINNCLGLLSYVYEYVSDDIEKNNPTYSRERLNEATKNSLDYILSSLTYEKSKYGTISRCIGYGTDRGNEMCTDMATILRHMRNAICHGNLQPIVRKFDSVICKVKFWDEPLKKANPTDKNFEIEMTITQLEVFVNDIADAYNTWK